VTRIVTPFLTYCDGKIQVSNGIFPESYCSFVKGKNDSLVYIFGPIMSLTFVVFSVFLYCTFTLRALMFLTVIAIVVLLINIIPGRNGDLIKFIKEKNK
jgi:hypothetical protein